LFTASPSFASNLSWTISEVLSALWRMLTFCSVLDLLNPVHIRVERKERKDPTHSCLRNFSADAHVRLIVHQRDCGAARSDATGRITALI
jgi:hypothetical protein